MLCRAKNAGVARVLVASSETALAPFSQNSAACRWPTSGSGQAQLGQSNPSAWLSRSRVLAVRRGPICVSDRFIEMATAFTPAAWSSCVAHPQLVVGLDGPARSRLLTADSFGDGDYVTVRLLSSTCRTPPIRRPPKIPTRKQTDPTPADGRDAAGRRQLRGRAVRPGDLSDRDLRHSTFSECTFAGATLTGADLTGAHLVESELTEVGGRAPDRTPQPVATQRVWPGHASGRWRRTRAASTDSSSPTPRSRS